jgi:hypothetical protein
VRFSFRSRQWRAVTLIGIGCAPIVQAYLSHIGSVLPCHRQNIIRE